MKKVEYTNELDHIFRHYWDIKLLYMDITKHDNGEHYFKVINRKGVTNVYMLEANDDAEKINSRIREIYANINSTLLNFNMDLFEERIRISKELTKNTTTLKRSVPVGL